MSDIYVCEHDPNKGLKIKVKRVDPLTIQKVTQSVKMPERPTYKAKTITGAIEEHPIMDMETAEQVDNGINLLTHYNERLQSAQSEQNSKVTNALFFYGADFELPGGDWEEEDEFFGLIVPQKLKFKKAYYLSNHLAAEDLVNLISKIMEKTGVGEDIIRQAEETFRSAIQDRDGESELGRTKESTIPRENSLA